MSKIKLVLDVVEDMRLLAASIEALADAILAGEEVNVSEAEPPKSEPITIEKVRAVLAEKSQSGKQPEVKALITKYGANKLADIESTYYLALLEEAVTL